MRKKANNTKIIYVRFHKDIDNLITEQANRKDKAKASLVAEIMTEYMQDLSKNCKGNFKSVTKQQLSFPSLSSSFFMRKGRSIETKLGKPMRVTMKDIDEGNMKLAAFYSGYSITEFRTAILVKWLCDERTI